MRANMCAKVLSRKPKHIPKWPPGSQNGLSVPQSLEPNFCWSALCVNNFAFGAFWEPKCTLKWPHVGRTTLISPFGWLKMINWPPGSRNTSLTALLLGAKTCSQVPWWEPKWVLSVPFFKILPRPFKMFVHATSQKSYRITSAANQETLPFLESPLTFISATTKGFVWRH